MIAPDEYRRLLSRFASGVTLVTTLDAAGRPAGLTASSFTSLSLAPPLVLVCVDHKAQCYPVLVAASGFAVNILSVDQQDLSRRFASRKPDKFEGVAYAIGVRGLPLIDGALAQLECTTVSKHPEGDHTIFVGRVEAGATGAGDDPLLYYMGRYDRLVGARG